MLFIYLFIIIKIAINLNAKNSFLLTLTISYSVGVPIRNHILIQSMLTICNFDVAELNAVFMLLFLISHPSRIFISNSVSVLCFAQICDFVVDILFINCCYYNWFWITNICKWNLNTTNLSTICSYQMTYYECFFFLSHFENKYACEINQWNYFCLGNLI